MSKEEEEEESFEIIEQGIYELSSELMDKLEISESKAIKHIVDYLYLPDGGIAPGYLAE